MYLLVEMLAGVYSDITGAPLYPDMGKGAHLIESLCLSMGGGGVQNEGTGFPLVAGWEVGDGSLRSALTRCWDCSGIPDSTTSWDPHGKPSCGCCGYLCLYL